MERILKRCKDEGGKGVPLSQNTNSIVSLVFVFLWNNYGADPELEREEDTDSCGAEHEETLKNRL